MRVLDLVDDVRVVSVPMRVRFRGVLHREAVLLHGPSGWGEFAPFLEYDDAEAARWLAAAVEACTQPWPSPVRSSVPVNATVPGRKALRTSGRLNAMRTTPPSRPGAVCRW